MMEALMRQFDGKCALVTGSSQGIGRAIAERLAADGARVAVVASRSQQKAQTVADSIAASGGAAQAFVADLTRREAAHRLATEVAQAFGGIDILVNVAGIDYKAALDAITEADFYNVIDTNLKSALFMMQAVAPLMAARGGGNIVNVSSVAAQMPYGERGLYCASKAALSMLTKSLIWELGPMGIRINSVAPGNVLTPERPDIMNDQTYAAIVDNYRHMTPTGRPVQSVQDIADVVAFLACDASRSLMGSEILCDDGFSVGKSGKIASGESAMIPVKR
jgi:3-oxoacyl-[acyl-carrier protein] reductase